MTAGIRDAAFRARRKVEREGVAALRARWHFRHAEALGPGAHVLGRPLVTTPSLRIGSDLLLWSHVGRTHFGGSGCLVIGDRVFVNTGAVILAFDRVTIEDDVAIASDVFISDSDNHPLGDRPTRVAPVVIGRGSWVATRALILPGVRIGTRSVVAAGSIVTQDVPDDTLVAGSPARPVRTLLYPPGRRTAWREGVGG